MSLFGDKKSFALAARPLGEPPLEPDAGAAATWANLQCWVKGKNLFEHTRTDTESFVDGVKWPAIYLARWFVHSWNELFYEAPWPIRTTRRNARDVIELLNERLITLIDDDGPEDEEDQLIDRRDRFVATHALQAAGAGAALPRIYFSRHGDSISIACAPSAGEDTRFHLYYDEYDVPAAIFLEAVREFISWVLAQLPANQATQSDSQLLSNWLNSLHSKEVAKYALLHGAGLVDRWPIPNNDQPFEEFMELPPDWEDAGPLVQPSDSPIAMVFRCVAPIFGDRDLLALRDYIAAIKPEPTAMQEIIKLTSKFDQTLPFEKDYEQGYSLATRLRTELQNIDGYFDIEEVLSNLGIPIEEYAFEDPDIDGAAICDSKHGPIVLINPDSKRASAPWARRMVLAHEFCHLLFDRRAAASLAIISGPWAPARLERRANAFAIELLLPRPGIKKTLGEIEDFPTDEEINSLMEKFDVGFTAATEHLKNRFSW